MARPAAGGWSFSRTVGARLAPFVALLAMMVLVSACITNVPQQRRPVQVIGVPQGPTPAVMAPLPSPGPAGPIKVALLVPLSGQAAPVGQAMLNAAQLALFEAGTDAVELLPRDTAGSPDGAAGAARDVLAQGTQLILGPLFSQDVRPVASVAAGRGVNVLAFTTDVTVAGGNALVMGFIPAEQVDRVVGFAAGRGLRRVVVLAPANAYGQAVTAAMRGAAARYGVTVVNTVQYDPAQGDLSAVVQNAAAGGGADAVLLADAGPALRGVVPAVRAGYGQAQLLGTGLWDEPGIGQEAGLQGAWYASPPPTLRAAFEQRYASLYGSRPPRLATLAYDAMSLAARLAQIRGAQGFDRSVLLDPAGFAGIDGVFRFNPTGVAQRGLAVLQVQPQGPVLLDPAPNSFAGAVF